MPLSPAITIRPVATVEEYRACQALQRLAWGIVEDGYVVPIATMISVQHAGGLVLGAFEDERLIGFAFGYLGRVHGRWALYSQLAAVDPAYQSHGVGGGLKVAQRDWARAQGLDLVAWSYDPLQSGNANFNLHRLGATSRTYQVNYFGERTDSLNAGLETDRLLVEWPVEERPQHWLGARSDEDTPAARVLVDADGHLAELGGLPDAAMVHIHIPPDIVAVKAYEPETAQVWQQAVRAAFLAAFDAGYIAMDFHREPAAAGLQTHYILRRRA